MTHKWFTEEKRLRSLRQIILANHFLPLQFSSHKHRRGNHLDQTEKKDLKKKKDRLYLSRRASVVFSQIPKWRKKQWLTVIDSKAKFLYDSQVPADSVQPVYTQTCRGSWEENMNITSVVSANYSYGSYGQQRHPIWHHLCHQEAVNSTLTSYR